MGRRKHVPLRTCIACRQQLPKRDLIRIVRTPEGSIEIDPKGKRSGRGAYLCRNVQCWDAAQDRGSLGRALKCPLGSEAFATLKAEVQPFLFEENTA